MSAASMVLLGAGVSASLAGVWALAGLSERSSWRSTPRVVLAAAVGVLGLGAVYQRAPAELRIELSLPLLFGVVAVLGVAAGAAKLDGALNAKNGARALRRAAGLVAGCFLGMASVAAVSFELLLRSTTHARFGWAFMLPTVAAVLVVFARRSRLAGAGAKALGSRGLALGIVLLLLLVAGRLLVKPGQPSAEPRAVQPAQVESPSAAEAPGPEMAIPAAVDANVAATATTTATTEASAAPSPAALASTPPAPAPASGELQVESITTSGMLEADARGGVERRRDRLQACRADPGNQQSGTLSLKIGVDAAGSVAYSKATGGDLVGTPLATCLLPVFYKMGFAAPASGGSHFEITLRAPPR